MVQSLRQQLITYPDLFIEYFQSRNNYRREYLVRFLSETIIWIEISDILIKS